MFQKDNRKKIVFLGTPAVAEIVLRTLVQKASSFVKVVLVVSQPPARSTRHQESIPSPVHNAALELGIPILTPQSAKDINFLNDLAALEPDLCITAAYGNYLPTAFLNIPKYGTVNIHPSLLPLYRGAAPVQRCLENGDQVTGVTVLYTVKEMDAGPIIAVKKYELNNEIKAPELLNTLFTLGTELLIANIKNIFSPSFSPIEQDNSCVTHAKKILPEEGLLDFTQPAIKLHNKVRAFAGWPGSKCTFEIEGKILECKIITTEIGEKKVTMSNGDVYLEKDSINVCCGDGHIIKIQEIQPAGKKVQLAKDFINGLKTKSLKILNVN
jgi:methionyl-tRNA formyltransferase